MENFCTRKEKKRKRKEKRKEKKDESKPFFSSSPLFSLFFSYKPQRNQQDVSTKYQILQDLGERKRQKELEKTLITDKRKKEERKRKKRKKEREEKERKNLEKLEKKKYYK